MDRLFDFISRMCKQYGIDESHGVKHARGTFLRAQAILETMDLTDQEERIALFAAALHDTCDSKYTDIEKASEEIREWLSSESWSIDDTSAVIGIITSMSYSKLKLQCINGVPVFPDHGFWQQAYHVARHADLLEGYIVARCYMYNQHKYPEKTEIEHWACVNTLFEQRVFRYVSDGWITIPAALDMVHGLETEARRCLSEWSLDWPEPTLKVSVRDQK